MKIKISSAKFWFILGVVSILLDIILAHLSNANLIHWSNGVEYVVSPVPFFWSIIFFTIGLILVVVKKLKK